MKFDYNETLYVSQMLPTVQGEGTTTGIPSVLLRLGGCNCRCPWCDTKYTWTAKNMNVIDSLEQFNALLAQTVGDYHISNLMITGGEPLLYYHNPLFKKILNHYLDNDWTIEMETNGTQFYKMSKDDMSFLDRIHLNISPKLNSGWYVNEYDYQNLVESVRAIIKRRIKKRLGNIVLKFVDDPMDRDRVNMFLEQLRLPMNYPVRLMPLTPARGDYENHLDFVEDYNKASKDTLVYCMSTGFILTPRIHLYLFDTEEEKI